MIVGPEDAADPLDERCAIAALDITVSMPGVEEQPVAQIDKGVVDLHEGEDIARAERAVRDGLFDRLGLHLDYVRVLAQIRLSMVIEVPKVATLPAVPAAGGGRYARLFHRES